MDSPHYLDYDAREVDPGVWRHRHRHRHPGEPRHKHFVVVADDHPHNHPGPIGATPDHHGLLKFEHERADDYDRDHRRTG